MKMVGNILFRISPVIIFIFGFWLRLNVLLFGHGFQTDEANLALNIINRNYLQLFLPLDNIQVAPPMFLVLSKLFYGLVNYNFTPYFSDILLRLVPFISGIAAIPAFGYLLYKLFKNKLVVLIGMFLLSITPVAISYSCIFKQYSLEMLVLILILITFLNIDFENKSILHNIGLFSLLGFFPFFSMTAFFIYPGGFLYLFTKISKKFFKKFLICIVPFLILFILYVLVYLYPVCKTHYMSMHEWWMTSTNYNILSFIQTVMEFVFRTTSMIIYSPTKNILALPIIIPFIIGFLLLLKDNRKNLLLIFTPIFVTFLFVIMHSYPLEERFYLFLTPCFLAICLYSIAELTNRFKQGLIIMILIFTFWASNYLILLPRSYVYRIHKLALPSNQIWDYWRVNFKNDGTLIFGDSATSSIYYLKLYENNLIDYQLIDEKMKLSKGTYYLIITSFYSIGEKQVENLLSKNGIKIVDAKLFSVPTSTNYIRKSFYMKFIKTE